MQESPYRPILDSIIQEWRGLPSRLQPWSFWIALYAAIDQYATDLPLQRILDAAWFFNGRDLEARPAAAYLRFHCIHFTRPWYSGSSVPIPMNPVFARTFEIGLVEIAPYAGTAEWYVGTLWAGRWGEGRRVRIDTQGVVRTVQTLWRS